MKILSLLLTLVLTTNLYAAGKLQNQDFKSEAELVSAGATKSSLLNDDKIYISANGMNDKLSTLITSGLIGGGEQGFLTNPSFENATVLTGWTNSAGTATANTSFYYGSGSQSVKIALSSQTLSLSQSVTANASNLSGSQARVSAWVKTTLSGIQVCALLNGTESSCQDVAPTGIWNQRGAYVVFDGTSTGIKIKSTGAVTGDVYVDQAFVGTAAQSTSVSTDTEWASYTPTFNGIGTPTSVECQYKRNGSDALIRCKMATGTATASEWRVGLPSSVTSAGTGTIPSIQVAGEFFTGASASIHGGTVLIEPSVTYVTFSTNDVFGSGTTGALTKATGSGGIGSSATYSFIARVPVNEWASTAQIITQSNADYDWTAYTPTYTGFGTVTVSSAFSKRQGSDLLLKVKFTSGTATATEARISLPGSLVIDSTKVPAIEVAGGIFVRDNGSSGVAKNFIPLMTGGNGYITVGNWSEDSGAGVPLSNKNGTNILNAGEVGYFYARVPISGWLNSNVIVGTFANQTQFLNFPAASGSTTVGNDIHWGSVTDTGEGILTYTDADGKFTANQTCWVTASATFKGSAAVNMSIKQNGTDVVNVYNPSTNSEGQITVETKLNPGDYITFRADITTTTRSFRMIVRK